MRKSEIKQNIKLIIESVKIAKENMSEYLQPYRDIKEHLEEIQNIDGEYGLDLYVDYEAVENDALRGCIRENKYIQEIESQYDNLLGELEAWADESSEKKSEQIQENYIDILSEIKESFDVDSIECEEDLDNMLFDMINQLEGMEI